MTAKQSTSIGIDDGTYTIVSSRRNENNDIEFRKEVNGFLEIPINDQTKIMLNMIKNRKIPIYKPPHGKSVFALGKKAHEMAFSWSALFEAQGNSKNIFQRTMKDGLLSVKDSKDSFNILSVMLRSMCMPLPEGNCKIAYAVPGKPINHQGIDPAYHSKVIKAILSEIDGKKTDAFEVNEAQAIVWSECEEEDYTGLALSWGAGMTNACFAMMGMPIFTFSYVGGGDWIDQNTADRCGVDSVVVNQIKNGNEESDLPGINLKKGPSSGENEHIERALITHYEILIENVINGVARFMSENKARVPDNIRPPIVIAGGTASPEGFIDKVTDKIKKTDFGSFKFGDIRLAEDNLYTVSKGLLRAAEEMER